MPQFFASTSIGLADVLEKELVDLGLKPKLKMKGGVIFESNWEGCYKANLHSRYASRILKPVLEFPAYNLDELYHNIRRHDFTKYIRPDQTMTVEAKIEESAIRDQRMVAMKVKDAVVDQFRDAYGVRPDVDNYSASLRVHVKAYKNQYYVSVDTSGESLFKRGYRTAAGEAPMKENLGAGLLGLAEWDRKSPIVDPMCGSGTILIEAALMALNVAPGLLRTKFAFQDFKGFEKEVWEKVVNEAADVAQEELDFKFYGFDHDREVLMKAKANAKKAGVDHVIEFKKEIITTLKKPV
ncbi:MAG: class I SAM-dependent RNA methyltransferase, partial [Pseudobdellovibrionaceae bacterium]